jgi:hypothetical protein
VCTEATKLLNEIISELSRIVDLSRSQADARRAEKRDLATELDRQLEEALGKKERAIGAWQQHVKEHGC